MVAVLRQEVDSLVRVVYLLAQSDRTYRQQLLDAAVTGKKWTMKDARHIVTDREMVELANTLHGWTGSVYRFGCAFIHLSSFHDYRNRDPMAQITREERDAVLKHLRFYHGGPEGSAPTFDEIVPFLPNVFAKIADNLEYYVKQLENDEELD